MQCCKAGGNTCTLVEVAGDSSDEGEGDDLQAPQDISKAGIKEIRELMACGNKTRLLVLDEQVDPHDILLNAALPTTLVVQYDSDEDTIAELVGLIRAAHICSGRSFSSIAFACHGGEVWQIATDCHPPMGDTAMTVAAAQPALSALKAAVAQGGRIDLLGCDLLYYDANLAGNLEIFYEMNFAATNNQTGELVQGGDWVLEPGDEDICAVYFDKEKVLEHKELMWGWKVDYTPIVGAVARAGQATNAAPFDDEFLKQAKIIPMMEASLKAAGEALGVVTGGSGKVAVMTARRGAKVLVKHGAKRAARRVVQLIPGFIGKRLTNKYTTRYFTKMIKKEVRSRTRKYLKQRRKFTREEAEKYLMDEAGATASELKSCTNSKISDLISVVAYPPTEFKSKDE